MVKVHLNRKLYTVLHCISEKWCINHALENVKIALENNADGVFLIGHRVNYTALIDIYEELRKNFPDIWLGINFLDVPTNWEKLSKLSKCCTKLNAIWIDNMPDGKIDVFPETQIFAGVAFKYIQPKLEGKELEIVCKKACEIVDVVTTSGDQTGCPPDISKIKSIRNFIGENVPLALASGIDENNVVSFMDYVDIFLVASSIIEARNEGDEYFVPEKVKKLAKLIHG